MKRLLTFLLILFITPSISLSHPGKTDADGGHYDNKAGTYHYHVSESSTIKPIKTITGKVVKVSDGDTITLLNEKKEQVKIRLYGIDAPEKKQAFGEVSRKFLADMVAGKDITVDVYDIDRYGRNVGLIIIGNLNVNREMVANGYAWVYTQYNKLPDVKEWMAQQDKAKVEKKGLWYDKNPIEPWNFRKEGKQKKNSA